MSVRRVLLPALATAALLATLSVLPALAGGFPLSDLGVAKSDAADPVVTGGQITYTLTVTNNGPMASTAGTSLADSLPADAAFVSATPSQGTCAYSGVLIHSVTCTLGSVANGGTATVTIVVTSGPPGTYTNSATVSDPTQGAFDPDGNNNQDTEVTTVVAATPSPSPSPTPSPTPTPSSSPASATATPLAAQLPNTVTQGGTDGASTVAVVVFLLSAGAFAVARLRSSRIRSGG
jgi:uncharacterized repeat protein (TIGR01451 family)